MTSNIGTRSISVRLTAREWVGVFAFITSSAVGFAVVFAQAKNVESQAADTANDLAQFKAKTDEKLDYIIEALGVIRGKLEK